MTNVYHCSLSVFSTSTEFPENCSKLIFVEFILQDLEMSIVAPYKTGNAFLENDTVGQVRCFLLTHRNTIEMVFHNIPEQFIKDVHKNNQNCFLY